MRRAFLPAAALCATLLSLSACAPLEPLTPSHIAPRVFQPAFELQGRLSASDGQQAASGRVEWQHRRGTDQLTLLTPLGQIAAQLDASPHGAQLQTADGQRMTADSIETLLPRVLGVDVPAAHLSRWVQATPDATAEVRQRDAGGRPLLVIDQGWRIEYLGYHSDAADAPPARLDISRGDARIRLVIDSWTTLP